MKEKVLSWDVRTPEPESPVLDSASLKRRARSPAHEDGDEEEGKSLAKKPKIEVTTVGGETMGEGEVKVEEAEDAEEK